MSEELDKKLRDRIADVFDNYEGSSADAGWALLREKYPEKEGKRPLAWWWFGIAAGLLLIAGTDFWLTEKTPNTAVKPFVSAQAKKHRADSAIANTTAPFSQQTTVSNQNTEQAAGSINSASKQPANQTNHSERIAKKGGPKEAAVQNDEVASEASQTIANVIPDSGNLKKTTPVAAIVKPTNSAGDLSETKKDTVAKKAVLAKNPPQTKVKYEGKKVFWGVFASAYYNFHDDFVQNNPINVGGGLSADIRLTESVKLSTGLGVFQNSANYYPADAFASPLYTSYISAKMLTLEMPVLLNVTIDKRGDYLAGGFSSAAYISEKYRETYIVTNNNLVWYTAINSPTPAYWNSVLPPDNNTQKHFDTLIWGKSLDLAAGIVFPLGKNQIVFEPFLKYPFVRIDDNPFAYGSAGLNLRFSFGAGK